MVKKESIQYELQTNTSHLCKVLKSESYGQEGDVGIQYELQTKEYEHKLPL